MNVPLDRDVIFLAEAGEEGTTRVGIQFMVEQHFAEIDAEYCLAEGGGVAQRRPRPLCVGADPEKIPRAIELTATGAAGPRIGAARDNAVLNLSRAIAAAARGSRRFG